MSALQLIFNEGKAEGEAKGKAEGEAEGMAKTLLKLLRQRGFEVDDAIERRVYSANDIAQLDAWLGRVLNAQQLEDVFR
jgi:predicted transposase YdaD